MDPLIGVAGAVFALVGVIFSVTVTKRSSDRKLKSDAGQQMIDQLQEDLKELRAERAKDRADLEKILRTQRLQGDYIGQLRQHIVAGNPPPPPPYPQGLIT